MSISQPQIESELIDLWREIFHHENIHADSDFFDLGGNSLTAIAFLSQVEERYGADALLPDTLFAKGRLAELATAISDSLAQKQ